MKRTDQIEKDFRDALGALEEAVRDARSELEIDGAIQRFEFTFELFWKFLRAYLQEQGLVVNTPKECFKEGFRTGLIKDEQSTLRMVDDRNLTVHIYDRATSREVFSRIQSLYVLLFRQALESLNEELGRPRVSFFPQNKKRRTLLRHPLKRTAKKAVTKTPVGVLGGRLRRQEAQELGVVIPAGFPQKKESSSPYVFNGDLIFSGDSGYFQPLPAKR